MFLESITIFTDGSSRGNPGPGGFGAIVVADGKVTELGGREEHTTNNRMEMMAAISALTYLSKVKSQMSVVIYCDSSYVINGITKWVFGWRKNNWITSTKSPVENRDLWEALVEVTQGKKVEWKQIGGHVGVAGNERCDEIATAFADLSTGSRQAAPELYSGVLENYRIKNILDIKENVSATSAKSSSKSHSRAKAYSYVSLVDGKIERHKTWAECEKRVKGRPAKFKKVLNEEAEAALIKEWGAGKSGQEK
ncbi:MAG: Ribonuclease H [Parcubacteria group bacterium GW2011_GWA2_47_16]|nr:MAG: Ribonuclease H [Parcubacteria group bacterium GW2011_GWA2_47_16]